MLLHGGGGGHAVEELDLGPVLLDHHLAAALVVARQHAAHHHEVRPRTESLGHVSRTRAASVTDDVTSEAVGCVRALVGEMLMLQSSLRNKCV